MSAASSSLASAPPPRLEVCSFCCPTADANACTTCGQNSLCVKSPGEYSCAFAAMP